MISTMDFTDRRRELQSCLGAFLNRSGNKLLRLKLDFQATESSESGCDCITLHLPTLRVVLGYHRRLACLHITWGNGCPSEEEIQLLRTASASALKELNILDLAEDSPSQAQPVVNSLLCGASNLVVFGLYSWVPYLLDPLPRQLRELSLDIPLSVGRCFQILRNCQMLEKVIFLGAGRDEEEADNPYTPLTCETITSLSINSAEDLSEFLRHLTLPNLSHLDIDADGDDDHSVPLPWQNDAFLGFWNRSCFSPIDVTIRGRLSREDVVGLTTYACVQSPSTVLTIESTRAHLFSESIY